MEFVIIPLLALAYRLRGNGWPFGTTSGRVVWCLACGLASTWLFGAQSGTIAIMRAALILPLGLGGIILPFAVAGGLLGATAYWFGTKVSAEPLRVAEPLVGAVFGTMLLGVWLCVR